MNKIAKKSGRIEKEDGSYVNEADIALARIRGGSRVGSRQVGTTATPVFSDSAKLEGRHEVIIFNDASVFLYWSFSSTPLIGEDTMPIPSGATMKYRFDPNDPQDIYLITSGITTTIKVVELR